MAVSVVSDISIPVPEGWEVVEADLESVVAIHREPASESGFLANQVVTAAVLDPAELSDWSPLPGPGARAAGREHVLDRGEVAFGGSPGSYLLATYFSDDQLDLTLQQWSGVRLGRVVTLSFTCATDDFPRLRRTAAAVAAGLSWGPGQ